MKTLVQLYETETKLDSLEDYYSQLTETEDKKDSPDETEDK